MKVQIVEYDPEWPKKFEQEKSLLFAAINIDRTVIEHFGSTSVVDLAAKPVIDILVGLPDFSMVDEVVPKIEALGYEYIAKYNEIMPFRRFLTRKPQEINTHNLHMVEKGCEFWNRHLLFRNYLRTHPLAAAAYADHKKMLAEREWQDINEYAYAKTEFITNLERQITQEK